MHESSDTVGIHDNNVLKINDFSSSINGVHNFNTILLKMLNGIKNQHLILHITKQLINGVKQREQVVCWLLI